MNRTRTVVRGAVLSGSSAFVSLAALLVVAKILTNALEAGDADIFFLLLLSADFLNIASNLGLSVSLPKLVGAAAPGEKHRIISSSLTFQCLSALALGAGLLVLWRWGPDPRPWLGEEKWRDLYPYLWLLPPLFFVGVMRDTAMAALAGLHSYGRRAAAIVVAGVAHVGLVFLLVWVMGYGLTVLTLCTVAAYGLAVIWLIAALPAGRACCLDGRRYAASVRFSGPLYANNLLNFGFQRFDTFLVAVLLTSPGVVTVYEIAKRFPVILSRGLGAALVPFLPTMSKLLAEGDRQGAARFLGRTVVLTAFLGYLGVLAMVVLQEPLVILLSNRDYLEAASVMGLLMTAICVAVQAGLMGQTLIALGKPVYVTASNIAMALLSIGANLILIPRYGVVGAGMAALAAAILSNALQTACVRWQGLPVNLLNYAKPQVLMGMSAAVILLGGGAVAWRAAALMLFVVLGFVTRTITLRDISIFAGSLLPRREVRKD